MAQAPSIVSEIDLLKETGAEKNCELIIFTTFSFDPHFFDNIVLKKLRKDNPIARIVVVADSNHIDFEKRTYETGREYRLILAPPTFHPKIFLFCSNKTGKTLIGSHNLTLSGFSNNLELSCKIDNRDITIEFLEIIKNLLSKLLSLDDPIFTDIDKQLQNKFIRGQTDLYTITNLELPILDQTLLKITKLDPKIRTVKIVSPFYSEPRKLIEKITNATKAEKVQICVQKNNHTLSSDEIKNLLHVEPLEIQAKQKRRIHSKIILFEGTKKLALVGSPNFTTAALNEIYQVGRSNLEIAVLVDGEKINSLLSELSYLSITMDEIDDSRMKNNQWLAGHYTHHIVTSIYDPFGYLHIEFASSPSLSGTYAELKSMKNEINMIDIGSSEKVEGRKLTFNCPVKLEPGTLLTIYSNAGLQVSNVSIVNILRSITDIMPIYNTMSPDQIIKTLAKASTFEDLVRLTISLWNPPEKTATSSEKQTSEDNSQPDILPSSWGRSQARKDILDILEELYSLTSSRANYPTGLASTTNYSKEDIVDIKNRIRRIPLKFTKCFENYKLKTDNSSSVYSIYLLYSIRLSEVLSKILQTDIQELLQREALLNFNTLIRNYGISLGDNSKLLSLLLYLESHSGLKLDEKLLLKLTSNIRINELNLFNTSYLEEMSIELNKKQDLYDIAEQLTISIIKSKGNLWENIQINPEIENKIFDYYQSIIPECKQIPKPVFMKAVTGIDVINLYGYGVYPRTEADGLPSFTTQIPLNEVLEKTLQIIKGNHINLNNESLTAILLNKLRKEDLRTILAFTLERGKARFTPGRIILKFRKQNEPKLAATR
ncbi:MAG: phospholipase D-like domain-containing protein [Candidatus Bathyarchaeota archaeon]|nr:phospholipase D-like domain-containing protein [Candidatus Bathyarchaeota archaeon]